MTPATAFGVLAGILVVSLAMKTLSTAQRRYVSLLADLALCRDAAYSESFRCALRVLWNAQRSSPHFGRGADGKARVLISSLLLSAFPAADRLERYNEMLANR